jgi:tRNA 2-thiouridine synthesizing protein A
MGLFGKKRAEDCGSSSGTATLSDGTSIRLAAVVDCIGDSCPRPQLMTKKAVGKIAPGEIIEVMVDNPSSMEALPPMCDELDATHLETIQSPRCWKIYIRKD